MSLFRWTKTELKWRTKLIQNVCLFISYSSASRDNCQLCDRPVNQLDYYADIEPDRDFDIYAMTDDPVMCSKPRPPERPNNARRFNQNFRFPLQSPYTDM